MKECVMIAIVILLVVIGFAIDDYEKKIVYQRLKVDHIDNFVKIVSEAPQQK